MEILVIQKEGCERLTDVESFEAVDQPDRAVRITFADGSTRMVQNAVVAAGPLVEDEERC